MRSRGAALLAFIVVGAVMPGVARSQPVLASMASPVTPICISSPFGLRNLPGPHAAKFHNGIDFPAAAGTWVLAVVAGEVVRIGRLGSSGLEIDVSHRDGRGGSFVTRYAHLGSVSPALAGGRHTVALGERLGRIGRSGITYGTHLHFEVHVAGVPVDPEPFFAVPRCKATSVER